ncbi:probable myosin light chain kinase DDB_G0279831 [Chenopodium quinoa]|uniref:probable myosin light chain kinase DDB_G0279831 n=1 Tax=Chenopodium quinoa TaxID=63459 RepID=UPI000B77B3B8|nr:probable myosin light chain kinase DDB_G0279831 [Chenopodium quinoa]
MENFRSMSCREGRMQMENCNNNNNGGGKSSGPPTSMQDLRSYSTSYASNYMQVHPQPSNKDSKGNHNNNDHKKNNKGFGSTSYSNSSTKGWSLTDPELQRKKRVASYKVYAVEGKMKGSFRKSFRWIKHTCSQVVHGWR